MKIRRANPGDHQTLLDIWLRSVRATHTFLSEKDIQSIYPTLKNHSLFELEMWVLASEDSGTIGFMGLDGNMIEALFLGPEFLRRGGGRLLVEHARKLKGALRVDVDEQNPDARRFYEAMGFVVESRSEADGEAQLFPLLHLRDSIPSPSPGAPPPPDRERGRSSRVLEESMPAPLE